MIAIGTDFDFEALLEAQRHSYGRELPARIRRIAQLGRRVAEGDPTAASLEDLEHQAHALAGSSGTFGFVDVGRAARALELAVAALRRAGPSAASLGEVAVLAARLEREWK